MPATMPVTEKGSFFDKEFMAQTGVRVGSGVPAKERLEKSAKAAASGKPNFMRLAGFLKTEIHLSDEELEEAIGEARINAAMRGAEG